MSWALDSAHRRADARSRRVAREFAARGDRAARRAWDRDAYFEPSLVGEARRARISRDDAPRGVRRPRHSTRCTYLVALEEIAVVDASVAVMHERPQLAADADDPALRQRAQKERFLKPMARGEMLGAFALSEPDAGSDAASLARRRCATATTGC